MEMIPVEILVEILVYCLPPIHHPQAGQRKRLASVCRRWHSVVKETPILWSKITSSDTLSQVIKSLARSNPHPIDVYGCWLNGYHLYRKGHTLAEIRSFVELVNCHMGRWRHVTLEVISNIPLGLTGGSAPLLESLEVWSEGNSPIQVGGGLVTLVPGAWMPRLREVCINGLEMGQLDTSFPPTLSKLIITGARCNSFVSFSKLLTILMSCPGLTALELSSRHDDTIEDAGWTALPFVELPALRELTLWKLGKQVIRVILQQLQFPHECGVRLSSDLSGPDPSANLTSTLAHHLDDLRNGGTNQITFTNERFRFVMRTQGPRWNMELEVGGFCGIRDIVLLFNPEGTTCTEGLSDDRIPVALEFRRDVLVSWVLGRLSSLADLGSIASLKVDTYQDAHVAILSHLATSAIKEGALPTWPLPGLRELHIEGPMAKIGPVIEFVERRRGKGNRLGTPAPLQRIEFEGNQVEGRDLSLSKQTKQARPDSLLDVLNLLDWGAQVIWYGERVHRENNEFVSPDSVK
ncbi:hypothetical protein FRC04_001494 [Tulasnella sp. 424]|nr:hypothetical protein FRC04_001494 [Tulasnella sp. 424]